MNWAKNARINSSGYSPAQWVTGRGYKLPWSLLDEKQSGRLASLELPDECHGYGCTMCLRNHGHQSQIATCVVSWCSSKRSHTEDCELRAGLCLAETQEKNKTDARTALVTHRCGRQLSQRKRRPCSNTRLMRRTFRGKNPCSMNLVNFLRHWSQT